MKSDLIPTVKFFPAGPQRVRFELQLNDHYTLAGEYVSGVLRDLMLEKSGGASGPIRIHPRPLSMEQPGLG